MTKPVSRLQWWPDASDPHALRALWVGSGWNYTIRWGDGTSERVQWNQPPRRHVYPDAGTYTIVGVSDLHQDWTISGQVTLRDSLDVGATFELLPGTSTVRAALAAVPDPVRYRVDWGDGTPPTEHGAGDLTPTHIYPWGHGTPGITVADVPARRLGVFTGPRIPEQPPPPDTWPDVTAATLQITVGFPDPLPPGRWTVAWPDWEPETLTPEPGQQVTRAALPGVRTVTVSRDGRHKQHQLHVPGRWADTDFDIEQLPGRRVRVRLTTPVNNGRPWEVCWGEDASTHPLPGSGDPAEHEYGRTGRHVIEVLCRSTPGNSRTYSRFKQVIVP